jgi:apolipoprotein D and lipocalin family protein
MDVMKNFKLLILSVFLVTSCVKEMPPAAKEAVEQNVDANQYLGTWYEIARLDHSFERGLEQVTADYSLEKDNSIKVVNRGYKTETKEWKEAIGKALFVDAANADGTRTGRLKVSFFGPFYGAYNIIELDKPYYNYAMVSGGQDYLWILSRTPQLTYPIKQELTARAKHLGYATDKLIFVKQANQVEYESGQHVLPKK